jgi:ParB-like chromosome segregation protein Spo0J
LERIYGIRHGGDRVSGDNTHSKTQKELSEEYGYKDRQIRDYKRLLTLIPELQELIETGKMPSTETNKVWAKLSQDIHFFVI